MTTSPSVAELVATFLAEHGVRRAYGVTGGEVLHVVDALRARDVEFILTHHEASAAYMADTEGQLGGRPGVCISTLGPGAANLLPGLAQATLERSPVLAITADASDAERAVRTHQILDIRGALQPLVKLSLHVTPENVWQALPAAWEAAVSGRPGAAHLAIPASVAAQAAVPGAWQVPMPETAAEPDAGRYRRPARSPAGGRATRGRAGPGRPRSRGGRRIPRRGGGAGPAGGHPAQGQGVVPG